jgi:hypothetical protein
MAARSPARSTASSDAAEVAAADRHHDGVELGDGCEKLADDGRGTCHQPWVVAILEIAPTRCLRVSLGDALRLRERSAPVEQTRPEIFHRPELHGIRLVRHRDDRMHAEDPRGKGDPLAVVAGRSGNNPAVTLAALEGRERSERAPDLEGPDGRAVLELDVHVASVTAGKRFIALGRSRRELARDDRCRATKVVRGRHPAGSRSPLRDRPFVDTCSDGRRSHFG